MLYPVMIPRPLSPESLEFDDRISSVHPLIFKSLAVQGGWRRASRCREHQVCGGDAEGSAAAACSEDRVAAGSHKLSCVWFLCKGLAYQH